MLVENGSGDTGAVFMFVNLKGTHLPSEGAVSGVLFGIENAIPILQWNEL
jgi:hypothetical protein